MAVTSHVYPKTMKLIEAGSVSLTSGTAGAFKMGLCTSAAATFGSTQAGFAFVSDVTTAYTEVSSGGYARVSLTTLALTANSSPSNVVWTCASPISFGSTITLSAASAFIYTTLVGTADASWPVVAIIDFGGTVSSTSSTWTYTIDGTNGLLVATSS